MRLFIALTLDEELLQEIRSLQAALKGYTDQGLRLMPEDKLHLTLKFLGEVKEEQVAAVEAALEKVATASSPFTLQLNGTGCFPESGDVRVVWAGISPQLALSDCVERIESSLASLGFARETGPFVPHITVARIRGLEDSTRLRCTTARGSISPCSQDVTSIKLMRSDPRADGTHYVLQREYPLGNR